MFNPAYQQVAKVIVDKAGNLSEAERKALKGLLDGFDDQPLLPFSSYSVTVNYDQTVKKLIKAGKYDWKTDFITSGHFPSNEKGVAEVIVYMVNFNRDISSEDAIKELDRLGLRPATLKELLSLGVVQPDLHLDLYPCNNPIVALGSTWRYPNGNDYVPCLDGSGSRRFLELSALVGDWGSDWQFAAVRKM